MKNILVTGGAGFIGSHLCEELVKQGHAVVAVDNFDPMYPRAQKEQNLLWLKEQPNFTLVEADIRDREKMEKLFVEKSFDHVFHLAARGGIPQSKAQPLFYVDNIIFGTMVILECSAKHKVKMIVKASTSSVYAQTDGQPSKESDNTDTPGSVYTASKKAAELLCHAYHSMYGIGVVNARFFSVYGPRGRHDMIIYKFAKNITEGRPILNIQPDPLRDFTYISDIVDGLTATLELPHHTYETINLGYGNPIAVSTSIAIIEKELGMKAIMGETVAPRSSDMAITNASSAKAQAILRWKPKTSLEEGIKKFIEWYKQNPQFTSDAS